VTDRRLIAAAGAGAVLVTVLVVGTGLGWWNGVPSGQPPTQPLAVHTSLEPRPAFFGDALAAEVDVDLDPAIVSTKSVRVVPGFDPYVPTGPPTVTRSRVGRHETMRYLYSIQCVSDTCVPLGKSLAVQFPRVLVTATAGRQALRLTAKWAATSISSRLLKGDTSATPHFRRPKAMPAPSYAVSPGTVADALTAAAGLLAAAALALLGLELRRLLERRRRHGLVQLTPLEAALAYTRDAAHRADPADRRKALGLLAKILGGEGVPALAYRAGDVAWSEDPPSPDRAIELAEEVENETRNGR
jgi:hypothetical protein